MQAPMTAFSPAASARSAASSFSVPGCIHTTFEPLPVESDHGFAVDHRHRCGGKSLLQQLIEGCFILADILLDERHALLVKELLHLAAEQSARLRVDGDRFGHSRLLPGQILSLLIRQDPSNYFTGSAARGAPTPARVWRRRIHPHSRQTELPLGRSGG